MPEFTFEEKCLWEDPDSDSLGLLLSDRIQFYVKKACLIDPFEPKNLGPASYDLRLGETFYKDGKVQTLKTGEVLTLPPNDIVFVTTKEEIRLPFYIIGRFNLRIGFVYQGILLGTGPQVDPGYWGRLGCPLYNLSNQTVHIPQGERFATIDFIKTTRFAENDRQRLANIGSEDDLYEIAKKDLRGKEGLSIKLYPQDKKRRDLNFRLPRYTISSTLVDLRDKVERLESTLARLQLVNYLAIAVVAGVVITLGALVATSIYNNVTSISALKEQVARICLEIPVCK